MPDPVDPPRLPKVGLQATDPTVRILEKPLHSDKRLGEASTTGETDTTNRDSRLIRIHDGQLVPVLEPRPGQRPEDRYRDAPPGKRRLGEGAIGQVNLVFDAVLGREVAMKVLREEYAAPWNRIDSGSANEATWRFLREARVTGQLEHPNIVPVHELGCRADGTVYYTMRVVRGRTLAEALTGATSLKQRLGLLHHFTDVCQAIAYAHSRGVLHRDIKPGNIMIGEFGETFVLDWGLARVTTATAPLGSGTALSLPPTDDDSRHVSIRYDDHEQTTMGGLVGTPQYMSPEQIIGDHQHLDARSDVWSLGVVLYILLTGRSPFAADTMNGVLENVLTKEVPPPGSIEPSVPVELQAIAMRALARNKSARYKHAGEMAADMTAYQSGERVGAYAYGFVDVLRRFLSRHRAAALISVVSCCALIGLAVLSYLRLARARDAALFAERRATAGQRLANSRYADSLVEKSRAAVAVDDVYEAEMLAAEAASIEDRPDAKGILANLAGSTRLVPTSISAPLGSCAQMFGIPRDGTRICLGTDRLEALSGTSTKWAVSVPGALYATAVNENESAVLSGESRWSVYSNADGHLIATGTLPVPNARTLVGSSHQVWLAATDSTGTVAIWNPHAASIRPLIFQSAQPVTALAFTRTHAALVLGGQFGKLTLLDFSGPEKKEVVVGDAHASILSLAVAPRDTHVVVGSSDGAATLWDLAKGEFVGSALKRQVGICSLALSEQGRWLLAGTTNSEVDLIDMQQLARVFSVPRAAGQFKPLGFDTDGHVWLLNAAAQASSYAIVEPKPRSVLRDRSNVLSLAWLPGTESLFSGGLRDSGICLFRIADGLCLDRIPVQVSQVRVTVVSPDGRFLVLAGAGSVVQVWDTRTRLPVAVGQVPIAEVRAAAFDGSQSHVLVGGVAETLFKLHVASGRIVEQWNIGGQVQALAVARNGQAILLGLRDGRVQRRDPHLNLLGEARMHQGWVSGIAFSPTLEYGVSIGADGKTLFWDVETLRVLASHQDHTGRATTTALSADGKYVATGGDDQTLVLSSGTKPWVRLAVLRGHSGTIRSAAFDQSSRWLASGSDDATVRLWDMNALDAKPKVIQEASGHAWGLRMVGPTVASIR